MMQRHAAPSCSGRSAQTPPTLQGTSHACSPLLPGLPLSAPRRRAQRTALCAAYEEAFALAEREDGWSWDQEAQWQGQQQRRSGRADTRRNSRNGDFAQQRGDRRGRPLPPKPLPGVVRVQDANGDAVRSSVQGAAGALVQKLEREDLVRLVAVDEASIWRTITVLMAADNMLRANIGHMIVWQPVLVTAKSAEPPDVPQGGYAFYTTKLLAGDVVTDNTLQVSNSSDPTAVGSAIIARIHTNAHTVVECLGAAANTIAIQALVHARKGLLSQKRDCAVVLAPERIAGNKGDQPTVLLSRLVLLECEPRNPGRLQIQASVVEN